MRGTFDLNGSFKEGMAPSRKGAKIKHSCRLLCLIAAAKCGQGQNRRLGNSLESVENASSFQCNHAAQSMGISPCVVDECQPRVE